MPTDTERMEFLETLCNRNISVGIKQIKQERMVYYNESELPIYSTDTRFILYSNGIEWSGEGNSVREAIDSVMEHI